MINQYIINPIRCFLHRANQNLSVLRLSTTIFKAFPSILCIDKMISAKKLIKLARKWQKLAALRRKRIAMPRNIATVDADAERCSTSNTVEKGHFVVYSIDERRFVLPLEYLNDDIVKELLMLAEEEFGLLSNSPLTLPCDAGFMKYVIDLIRRRMSKDVERQVLMSMASIRCSSSSHPHQELTSQPLPICSF